MNNNEFAPSGLIEALRSFGKLYDEASRGYRYNEIRISELDGEIQDILHEVEFSEHIDSDDAVKLVDELRRVRQERRACKNENERLKPLVDWFDMNKLVKNQLAAIQGNITGIAERQKNRTYVPRVRKQQKGGV